MEQNINKDFLAGHSDPFAASACRFSTAQHARTISAVYPAKLKASAATPAQISLNLMPITGKAKNTKKI